MGGHRIRDPIHDAGRLLDPLIAVPSVERQRVFLHRPALLFGVEHGDVVRLPGVAAVHLPQTQGLRRNGGRADRPRAMCAAPFGFPGAYEVILA